MALTVETGSGSATAESYCTVEYASTYHSNRGNAAWAALFTDAIREQCLRKATDYMVAMYRDRWQGYRVYEDQALCWPRYDCVVDGIAIDNDVIPEPVKRACAELALKAGSAELYADMTQATTEETVGDITVKYDGNSPQRKRYALVEAMLAPYLSVAGGNSGQIKLVRC